MRPLVSRYDWVFQYISERLQGDRQVVLDALDCSLFNFKYVDHELRNSKEFVMFVLAEYMNHMGPNYTPFLILKYIDSDTIKDDKEVAMLAIG
jgi:hypothetical protein